MTVLQHIAAFRREPQALVDAIPYMRFLGIAFEQDASGPLVRMRYSDPLIGNASLPALHGGTLGALLETSAILQILWEADSLAPSVQSSAASQGETLVWPKTITITVAYLRSGKPRDTLARAQIEKRGRRVVSVRASAWQEAADENSRPIATASGHFLIVAKAQTNPQQADMLTPP